jgi:hypothetical protein
MTFSVLAALHMTASTALALVFFSWTSYLIRLAEAGGSEHRFDLYADCLWFVIVTSTTTGYGLS